MNIRRHKNQAHVLLEHVLALLVLCGGALGFAARVSADVVHNAGIYVSESRAPALNRFEVAGTGGQLAPICMYSICKLADVNGDGMVDFVSFARSTSAATIGDVYVSFSDGHDFGPFLKWHDSFCLRDEICEVGDVNGDGLADIISFVRTNHGADDSDVKVALSNGVDSFGPVTRWHDYFCTLREICAVGDVNGDGLTDLISFIKTTHNRSDSDVYVALSNGVDGFGAPQKWHDYFCTLAETCAVGDVNGDGLADIVTFVKTNNAANDSDVYVALSNGVNGFGPGTKVQDYFCTRDETCAVADVDGDGQDDLVAFGRTTLSDGTAAVAVWVARSTGGQSFAAGTKWANDFCHNPYRFQFLVGDVNGDGSQDAVCTAEFEYRY